MVYRLILQNPEDDQFECTFDIAPSASLFELHETIIKFVDYPKDLFTTFIFCDASFNVLEELTLEAVKEQDRTIEEAFSDRSKDLVYVFDTILERCFFIDLVRINMEQEDLSEAKLIRIKGDIPKPQLSSEELEDYIKNGNNVGDDFCDDLLDDEFDDLEDIEYSEDSFDEYDY